MLILHAKAQLHAEVCLAEGQASLQQLFFDRAKLLLVQELEKQAAANLSAWRDALAASEEKMQRLQAQQAEGSKRKEMHPLALLSITKLLHHRASPDR